MKILLITDNHTPKGGAENYFFELKARLKKYPSIEVYSIGFAEKAASGEDYFVLKAARSNIAKLFFRLFSHPFVYAKLRKKIREINPDIIHLHNIKQYTAAVLKAVKPYPVVQTAHDFSAICPTAQNIHQNGEVCATGWRGNCFWLHRVKYNPWIYFLLVCAFLKLRKQLKTTVSHFLAPSPLLADYLERNHFKQAHYISPFKKEPATPSFANIKPYNFLFAGNLGAHKGVHLLIEEFALACRKNSNLRLMMAGSGPLQKTLEMQVKKLGIEKNVLFLGWQDDLEKFYEEAIAVIFPSIGMESFGLVITEAMSYARPIIGINRGTSAWLIDDNHNGLLFDPHKKGDLAAKILTLAGNVEKAKGLGMNGLLKLERFINNEASLDKIVGIYKSLCRA